MWTTLFCRHSELIAEHACHTMWGKMQPWTQAQGLKTGDQGASESSRGRSHWCGCGRGLRAAVSAGHLSSTLGRPPNGSLEAPDPPGLCGLPSAVCLTVSFQLLSVWMAATCTSAVSFVTLEVGLSKCHQEPWLSCDK